VLVGVVAVGVFNAAAGAAVRVGSPAILSLTTSPQQVSARGGSVGIHVRVQNARTCGFRGQHGAFTSLGAARVVACGSGRATVVLPLAPNHFQTSVTIHYYVRARGSNGRSVQRMVSVVEGAAAAATPPAQQLTPLSIPVTSLPDAPIGQAYGQSLAASGGTPPYAWSIASGALPAGLTLSALGTISGTPTTLSQTSLTVRVTDSGSMGTQTAMAAITINVVAAPPPSEKSSNWSGYVAAGGPFTAVAGTFNVPSLTAAPTRAATAEWVGIDGSSAADPSLIQAGVQETYDPSFAGAVRWFAWWEILPDAETPIPLPVAAGNVITVTINQLSAGLWRITVTNDTSGQTFTTTESYSGIGASAEWIVEAPISASTGKIETLGPYTPNVTFSNLSTTGTQTSLTDEVMVQNGVAVSTPSVFTPAGFSVAYGAVVPNAPSP
jgi:peptidase A4-like protein/putative Ig domain-containing protein